MASRLRLLKVYLEARQLLLLPDNNFDWSGWDDAEEAVEEIDGIIARMRETQAPVMADILFLPTGPMQETSLSSGWGDEFCALADRYDEASAAPDDCPCYLGPVGLLGEETYLGTDSHFADISILTCSKCGQKWVRYHYENEAFSRSGRWFLAAVDESVQCSSAKLKIETSVEYWCGGSYFDGKVFLSCGPIHLS